MQKKNFRRHTLWDLIPPWAWKKSTVTQLQRSSSLKPSPKIKYALYGDLVWSSIKFRTCSPLSNPLRPVQSIPHESRRVRAPSSLSSAYLPIQPLSSAVLSWHEGRQLVKFFWWQPPPSPVTGTPLPRFLKTRVFAAFGCWTLSYLASNLTPSVIMRLSKNI